MPQEIYDTGSGSAFAEWLTQLAVIGGTVLLIFGLAVTAATWLVVRRIRRSGRLRRSMDTGALAMRSCAMDRGVRQLAALRLELRRSTLASERSLAAAIAQGCPVGELPAVAAGLGRAERALEDQLRLAELEPNRDFRRAAARGFREQVHELSGLSAQLRDSLRQLSADVGSAQIHQADAHLRREVDALHTWSAAYGSHHRNKTTPA